jgi:hypothetical protein
MPSVPHTHVRALVTAGNVAHACFLGIDTIPPDLNDCPPYVIQALPPHTLQRSLLTTQRLSPSCRGSRELPHKTAEDNWKPLGYNHIFPTVDGSSGSNSKLAVGIIDSATVYRNRGSSTYSAVWLRRTSRLSIPLLQLRTAGDQN